MADGLRVRFWGVRGSIASAGEHTREVGGNTSCLEVQAGSSTLILDAGTGIRALGETLVKEGRLAPTLLLSHLHWDHIQGLPFFAPAWRPDASLELVGARSSSTPDVSLEAALSMQMRPPHFPVSLSAMRAKKTFREIADGEAGHVGDALVTARVLHHPDGVVGYRIEHGGRSLVYATDTEHRLDGPPDPVLVELARGADLLVYDAMYTDDEMHGRTSGIPRVGWGHSTWSAGVDVAEAAGVGRLVLFHHDPSRDDAAVRALELEAVAARAGSLAAREGLVLELPRATAALAA